MSVYLTGTRRCEGCSTLARTSNAFTNAFTNGIGWRELCGRCVNPAPFPPLARPVAVLAGAAR